MPHLAILAARHLEVEVVTHGFWHYLMLKCYHGKHYNGNDDDVFTRMTKTLNLVTGSATRSTSSRAAACSLIPIPIAWNTMEGG